MYKNTKYKQLDARRPALCGTFFLSCLLCHFYTRQKIACNRRFIISQVGQDQFQKLMYR